MRPQLAKLKKYKLKSLKDRLNGNSSSMSALKGWATDDARYPKFPVSLTPSQLRRLKKKKIFNR